MQPPAPAVAYLHPDSRLQILELPATVEDDSLHRLFHSEEQEVPAEVLAADRKQLEQLGRDALSQALARSGTPPLSGAAIAALSDTQSMTIGQPMDPAGLAALQGRYPADAYLRVRITDYGQTPKSWKSAYITFEVTTTLGIGALLYTRTITRPLAIAYVAEEGIEEFSEGYAGFRLLNRLSRPVRIDADLVDGVSGKVLWHDTETGLAGWHWKNVWHMGDATRDLLLKTSAEKAVTALVQELQGK